MYLDLSVFNSTFYLNTYVPSPKYFVERPIFSVSKTMNYKSEDKTLITSLPVWSSHVNGVNNGTFTDNIYRLCLITMNNPNDQEAI